MAGQYEHYPITGIRKGWGPDGSVPIRQEIDEWYSKDENARQVYLFIFALRKFEDIFEGDPLSFFQIAGIHGMPYKPWDEPDQKVTGGYCAHSNILFPTWHRPYLLLFEQRLYEIMVNEIIPMIHKDQKAWREAADSWRLPYWDWALHSRVPKLCDEPTIYLNAPEGLPSKIDNPLYRFKMPSNQPMSELGVTTVTDDNLKIEYGKCIGTSRCPTEAEAQAGSEAWISGSVNNDQVAKNLTKHQGYKSAAEIVYRLLTYPELDYPDFATTARPSEDHEPSKDVSLEFIHNLIHNWTGGKYNGHMAEVPVAGFDPIFWLHHCNVDRLAAIWQELNPNKWWDEAPNHRTPETPLRPFHQDKNGTAWTSNAARQFMQLGYTYPELQRWLYKGDEEKYIKDIKSAINEKYGVNRKQALDSLGGAYKARSMDASARSTLLDKPEQQTTSIPRGLQPVRGGIKSTDYAISVRYSKFGLGGHPFNISIHLAPRDLKHADPERDHIADVYNFSTPSRVNGELVCSNCAELEDADVRGTSYIPINYLLTRLAEEGSLESFEEKDVEPFLKRLYWRVTKYGAEVSRSEMEKINIDVRVSRSDVHHYADGEITSHFRNFRFIPSLQGGSSGALDPGLKVGFTTA